MRIYSTAETSGSAFPFEGQGLRDTLFYLIAKNGTLSDAMDAVDRVLSFFERRRVGGTDTFCSRTRIHLAPFGMIAWGTEGAGGVATLNRRKWLSRERTGDRHF